MELQHHASELTQPAQQPSTDSAPSGSPAFTRCQARNRNGSRCRLHTRHPGAPLCRRHADRAGVFPSVLDDSLDLSEELLEEKSGAYDSTESINCILSNVVELLIAGRISTRRAAVITYALSLMLRSSVVAERQALGQLPLDYAPRPLRQPLESLPSTNPEAPAAYEHLRS